MCVLTPEAGEGSREMSTENVQEAAAAAAEKLAEAAAAAADEPSSGEDAAEELLGGEVDQWSFLTKALVAVVVIVVCLIANKVSCDSGCALIANPYWLWRRRWCC